jgi:hypothetical protein
LIIFLDLLPCFGDLWLMFWLFVYLFVCFAGYKVFAASGGDLVDSPILSCKYGSYC